jgi:hypothetical protein
VYHLLIANLCFVSHLSIGDNLMGESYHTLISMIRRRRRAQTTVKERRRERKIHERKDCIEHMITFLHFFREIGAGSQLMLMRYLLSFFLFFSFLSFFFCLSSPIFFICCLYLSCALRYHAI